MSLNSLGKLNSHTIQALEITEVERSDAERILLNARLFLEQIELASTSIERDPKTGGEYYRIAAFPDEGRVVRERILSDLGSRLGAERAQRIVDGLGGWGLLGTFGRFEKRITFEVGDAVGEDGMPYETVWLIEELYDPVSGKSKGSSSTLIESDDALALQKFRHLLAPALDRAQGD